MIVLELPYPPSVNHYWTHTRRGTFISAKGMAYRQEVQFVLRRAKIFKPLEGMLELKLKLLPPDKRKRDIDNVLKAILDSLAKGGLMRDDNQVKRLGVEMMEKMDAQGMVIMLAQQIDPHETITTRSSQV